MFTPSKYQEQIFNDIQEATIKSIVVSAVPGAGKTETIKRLVGHISPDKTVCAVAFNKDAAAQMGKKFDEMREENPGIPSVLSSTIHSLGNGVLKSQKMSKKTDSYKYSKIIRSYLESNNIFDPNFQKSVAKLIDMIRLTLSGASISVNGSIKVSLNEDELFALVTRFDIDIDVYMSDNTYKSQTLRGYQNIEEWRFVLAMLPEILKAGITQARYEGMIDFTDMIYMPVALDLKPTQYDYVLVDEAQDLSPCQRAFVLSARKPGGYFVAVGDRNQSIYGFAGASLRSLDEIIEATGAIERPLSICYRCPRSVIAQAASIYPGIEAAETAPEGTTEYITEDRVFSMVQRGDLILSRTTAPLVSLCLELLRDGQRANVRGRDIGAQFTSLLDKVEKQFIGKLSSKFEDFTQIISQYKKGQIEILEKGGDENESKIDTLNDKIDTLNALYDAYTGYFVDSAASGDIREFINGQVTPTLDGFKSTIQAFFTEKPDAQIILSTGHRSKGLEYPRVIIIGYDQIPHPRAKSVDAITQEMNLKYVMTTRAKKELYLCVSQLLEIEETTDNVMTEEPAPVAVEPETPAAVETVAEPAPLWQWEEKGTRTKGKKGEGRQKERVQYSQKPEAAALLLRAVEILNNHKPGDKRDVEKSELLDRIILESPLLAAILASETGPEDDGPNGGGKPELAADSQEERRAPEPGESWDGPDTELDARHAVEDRQAVSVLNNWHRELSKIDPSESRHNAAIFTPGQKVTWQRTERGGYGFLQPVAAIVMYVTAKRVRIAAYETRTNKIDEKSVPMSALYSRYGEIEQDTLLSAYVADKAGCQASV